MTDLVDIGNQILEKINTLEKAKGELIKRGNEKAMAIAEYDKQMAITIVSLKNGVQMILHGQNIENPPATIIDKIARGICYAERLAMEEADSSYKALITGINVTQAQLNGLQSLNKHLDWEVG